jgi:hypothetical protein
MSALTIFRILWLVMAAISILLFVYRIRTQPPLDINKKKKMQALRTYLVWTGSIILWLSTIAVGQKIPDSFEVSPQFSEIFSYLTTTTALIGIVLSLYGSYYWAKYKSREGWWACCGITTLGFIVLMYLQDKNPNQVNEEEHSETPPRQKQ